MNPDPLNDIGVLRRREIEARILAPVLDALGKEFGRDRVVEIAREVIVGIAREQGAQLAAGGNTMADFVGSTEAWRKGDPIETDVLAQSDTEYAFNVTRCCYAEMYRALGIPELGATLSCNRDASLIESFNPQLTVRSLWSEILKIGQELVVELIVKPQ